MTNQSPVDFLTIAAPAPQPPSWEETLPTGMRPFTLPEGTSFLSGEAEVDDSALVVKLAETAYSKDVSFSARYEGNLINLIDRKLLISRIPADARDASQVDVQISGRVAFGFKAVDRLFMTTESPLNDDGEYDEPFVGTDTRLAQKISSVVVITRSITIVLREDHCEFYGGQQLRLGKTAALVEVQGHRYAYDLVAIECHFGY